MINAEPAARNGVSPLPVTVLTGYLGAGKTTLLNHILAARHGGRYAVIVNEFSDLDIDGDLIVNADEEIITVANGCLCCKVRADLLVSIKTLLMRNAAFNGIFIETSGLADPGPIAQSFFTDPLLITQTRLDAVIAVADARHLRQQLINAPETEAQIAAADLILLNKTDLVSGGEAALVETTIRGVNPFADIRRTIHSKIDMNSVLNRHAFDLNRVLEHVPGFTAAPARHCNAIENISFQVGRPLEMDRFLRWVDSLIALQGDEIPRIKGILAFAGEHRPFVFQAVHRIMEGDFVGQWPAEKTNSKLVVIGRNLDRARLRRNFEACQTP